MTDLFLVVAEVLQGDLPPSVLVAERSPGGTDAAFGCGARRLDCIRLSYQHRIRGTSEK